MKKILAMTHLLAVAFASCASAESLLAQAVAPQADELSHAVCGKSAGLAPCEVKQIGKPRNITAPLALYAAGEAADFASTMRFRARGWQEANPLMRGSAGIVAVKKLGLVAALTALDVHMQRHKGPTKRRRIVYLASRALLTAWNLKQASGLHTIHEQDHR